MSDYSKLKILIQNSKTIEQKLAGASAMRTSGGGPSTESLAGIALGQQQYITVMLSYIAALHKRIEFLEKTATQKGTANLNHNQLKNDALANISIPSAPLPSQVFGKG